MQDSLRAANILRQLPAWALALLLLALPFELVWGLQLPGLLLTNIELLALATLVLWGLQLAGERRLPHVPGWLALPLVGFIGLLLLSSLLAPEHGLDALKFSLRQGAGGLLALCIADCVAREGWPLTRRLLLALGLGGVSSAALGLWEMGESELALQLLQAFKRDPSLIGGQLRLSATFSFANIAGMYYEALLGLTLAGSLALLPGRLRPLGALAALLLYLAIVLTYSRAALVSGGLVLLALVVAVALRWRRGRRTWQSAGLALGLLGMALLIVLGTPSLRLRLINTDIREWYRASYQPAAIGALEAGQRHVVPIRLTNTGLSAWPHQGPRVAHLAYHWLDAQGQLVTFEGVRSTLPHKVPPGESLQVDASVLAPSRPGSYLLAWDLVLEHIGWFSQLGTSPVKVPVQVVSTSEGQAQRPIETTRDSPISPKAIEIIPPPPDRAALWRTAIELWRERPLLGIGPDVFRHIYGQRMGLAIWDDRTHVNNLYLEILTGAGLLGLGALLALLWMPLSRAGRLLLLPPGQPEDEGRWWSLLAALLGLGAFVIHGLLDVFLAFSATYMLFWAWLGMLAGLSNDR